MMSDFRVALCYIPMIAMIPLHKLNVPSLPSLRVVNVMTCRKGIMHRKTFEERVPNFLT